jgi:thiol:disulfide interchange protein DsbD
VYGPIVGTLLVEAASKGGITNYRNVRIFIGFNLTIYVVYISWLVEFIAKIRWLVEYCQSSFIFLELALAFKFLSNADLVLQLHFLERSVPCDLDCHFGTLAFYLFGKITLPHDSPMNHISVGRLYLGW